MFKMAEIELEMENTIGITLETVVGVQSAILHVNRCRSSERYTTRLPKKQPNKQTKRKKQKDTIVQVSNFQVSVPTCTVISVLTALHKLMANVLFTEIQRLTQDPKTINSKTLTR